MTTPELRICYSCWVILLALVAPFWVVICFVVFGMVTMNWYIEGVVLVMIVEYVSRGMHYGGYIGWLLFLIMIVLHFLISSLWTTQEIV